MTVITLSKVSHGWQAIFRDSPVIPNGEPLPLPFTLQASAETVKADLRKRFPGAAFVVKAGSRDERPCAVCGRLQPQGDCCINAGA
jgi:hypothetical protein